MKRSILLFVILISAGMAFAADGYEVRYSQPQGRDHQLQFTTGDYSVLPVTLQGVTYTRIESERRIVTDRKGFAELPYFSASVMIEPDRNYSLEVVAGSYVEIPLEHPLVPSRGVIYRTQDPAAVPWVIDPRSVTDSWYPVSLAKDSEPFILRDIRGTSVYVYPFQYNAAAQVLRVYREITVILREESGVPVNPLVSAGKPIAREMDAVYRSVFINYATASRDLTIGEYGEILVLTTSRDESAIAPYVQWKREKGYNVTVEVVPVNTTANSVVQNAYINNSNILYVLMVGDWADIKSETSPAGRPMDPQVGCVAGTDDYADIAVGRFSANSPADVTVQVNKVIAYERDPEAAAAWYSAAIGVASAEGAGIGDDGESDIQHENVIYNDKLDPFTYDAFTTVYDPGATTTMVSNAVNAGASVINYTGHGWGDGWGTTGFSSSNVANLTNGSKLPFVVSVACNNGDFDLGTCFAEAWLRKSGGGAVMFLGASISQPWAEPMRGQDYFMDILIGGYDYTAHPGQNGISTTEQRTTLGSIVFNGLTLMCTESGGSADWETAKTWNFFGDPSLQARTAAPATLNVSSNLIMTGVPFTTNISTAAGPVENALVALSQGSLYYHGLTDASGNVTINHALSPGNVKMVVTAFNTSTYYQDVSVIPPTGAYIALASVEVVDNAGNGNGQMDYGETFSLTIGLVNVGTSDAANVTATLNTSDDFVTILDGTADYGLIPAGDTVYVTEGFQAEALASLPDNHFALFNLSATETVRDTWVSSFSLLGHAPVIGLDSYTIDDAAGNGNGRLDPGETALIAVTASNTGSADAYNAIGSLTAEGGYVTVNNSPLAYGNLAAGQTAVQSFEVTVDAATPAGYSQMFNFDLQADLGITGSGSFVEYVGQIPVLLVDLDLNHNSPDMIAQCLTNLQVGFDRVTEFPADLNLYSSVFVCLGTYSDNYVLNADEGQMLADFLNAGGNLYMEGADTWYYDQQYTPTPVHPMFNISGIADGSGDLSQVNGQPGSMAEEMSFQYNGDNSYVDHIGAIPPAMMMFMNYAPEYGAGISYDAGTYRTVGFSFEFGGLQDGEKNKDDLMIEILEFFGISGVWTDIRENAGGESLSAGVFPNPFTSQTLIRFEMPGAGKATLDIYSVSGQRIARLLDGEITAGTHEIIWDGTSDGGTKLSDGFYFFRILTDAGTASGKMLLAD